jgi:hypothetical protein
VSCAKKVEDNFTFYHYLEDMDGVLEKGSGTAAHTVPVFIMNTTNPALLFTQKFPQAQKITSGSHLVTSAYYRYQNGEVQLLCHKNRYKQQCFKAIYYPLSRQFPCH